MAARYRIQALTLAALAGLLVACSESGEATTPTAPIPASEPDRDATPPDGGDTVSPPPAPPRERPKPAADEAPDLAPDVEWVAEREAIAEMGGERFAMEIADTFGSRYRGLSFRTDIPADTGMVFVFPDKAIRDFVMRDCKVPSDIAYTTDTGRIVQAHAMTVQDRVPGEQDGAYERRLTRYSSKFPVSFVFEFAGGTLERLGIGEGDVITADFEALKGRAKP